MPIKLLKNSLSLHFLNIVIIPFFSIIFVILLCEAVLRYYNPGLFQSKYSEFNPDFGWTEKADFRDYKWMDDQKPVLIEFNKNGYRDIDHIDRKPPKTRRIVVLGDSFSEAVQVNITETYWWRMSSILNSNQSNYRWETLNFGVGSYGTTQEYLTLCKKAIGYQPDLIVLQMFPLNDICDNSIEAVYIGGPQDYYRPYLDPMSGYSDITQIFPYGNWFRRYFYTFRYSEPLFFRLYRKLSNQPQLGSDQERMERLSNVLKENNLPNDFDIAGPWSLYQRRLAAILFNTYSNNCDQFDFIKVGWTATEKSLQMICEKVRELNIPILVVFMPHDFLLGEKYANLQKSLPFSIDRHYPENRLKRIITPYKIPSISLIDIFEDNIDKVLPFIDGHLNKNAHRIISDILAKKVIDMLPEYYEYKMGTELKFGKDDFGGMTLIEGFSPAENTISWTIQPVARLAFTLSEKKKIAGDCTLTIHGIPFAPPLLGNNQYMDIFINNVDIGRWMFSEQSMQQFKATISSDLINQSSMIGLTFRFSERKSPKSLNLSSDIRLLGIGLASIKLDTN